MPQPAKSSVESTVHFCITVDYLPKPNQKIDLERFFKLGLLPLHGNADELQKKLFDCVVNKSTYYWTCNKIFNSLRKEMCVNSNSEDFLARVKDSMRKA